MRDYLLYIKVGSDQAQAHVTPCFTVDQTFWSEREGCQLHVIGRSPSLALAFSLREMVNARLRERQAKSRPLNENALADLRQMALSTVRETSALYGREFREDGPLQGDWFAWETDHSSMPAGVPLEDGGSQWLEDQLRLLLAGRALLWGEIETLLRKREVQVEEVEDLTAALQRMVLAGDAEWLPGVRLSVKKGFLRHRLELVCQRCGSGRQAMELVICHTCEQGCAYCTVCLGMGRSKCCTPYLLVPAKAVRPVSTTYTCHQKRRDVALLDWPGRYSKEQAVAAEQARRFVASLRPGRSEFLIWAVCGAGKTELLFPAVAESLSAGGRVLIATPRKDVVLELAPRIQRVFPHARVIAVHGSSPEKWEESDITIATTHQVMRFHSRFPLVVLDEADAFPYHNDPVLYRALSRAVQAGGKTLYLSATPPRYLQKKLIPRGRGVSWSFSLPLASSSHVLLPGRYHGNALPVPQILTVQGLHKRLMANRPITSLIDIVKSSLAADRQVFLFVPRVEDVERVLAYTQKFLPEHAPCMAGVHAADPLREDKVRAFREKRYTVMVTTTILERGVTIPRSDVVVVGAEAPVFDEASLVQIAGRVGRSADSPDGTVLFMQSDRASAPKAAVKQIVRMNQLAHKLRTVEGGA